MRTILQLSLFILVLTTTSFSQDIKVYFNQSVDNSVSSIADAQTSGNLEDTICYIIDNSSSTLDIAVWDNGSAKIVTALNNAYNRGVIVRYITSSNSFNTALTGLNANIPVLERNSGLTSDVMHNKFVIADNQILLTGSMNFGSGSMEDDYNNIVIISNSDLAANYTTEFNEMWGSAGALPNTSNSKFGPDKTDNTIHVFDIGGSQVLSYFSPTDHTTDQIVTAINSADYTLDVAIFTFTNNDLGDAVLDAKSRGVAVRVIMENESYFGSEYNSLVSNGIPVISHQDIQYDFHHKYCIVDAQYPSSDPLVVTGSHNWTNSAEDEYDENTLIIHDEIVANKYLEEFSQRFNELTQIKEIEENLIIYPNPFSDKLIIEPDGIYRGSKFELLNSLGQIVFESELREKMIISTKDLKPGIYSIKVGNHENKNYYFEKLIKVE